MLHRLLALLLALNGLAAADLQPSPWAADLSDPSDVALAPGTAEFRIRATISGQQLDGTAVLTWTNSGAEALTDLVFQTYANGEQFHGASFTVEGATIDGVAAVIEPYADGLAVRVIPAAPIAAQATVAIGLTWRVVLSSTGGLHGLLTEQGGVVVWHAWYPELAPYRGGRWLVDPVADLGDPVRAAAHHVVVDLTLPDGGPLISGGTVIAEQDLPGPTRTVTIAGAYQRNLTLVIGEQWNLAERLVGSTLVRTWTRPGHQLAGERVLAIAADAMGHLSTTFAPYPYREFEVVDYQLGASVGGVESSGLILITGTAFEPFNDPALVLPPESLPAYMLQAVVCHEVAHQWWYGAVGNDAVAEPWMDESLTQWTTNWLLDRQFGPAVRRAGWQTDLMTALAVPRVKGFTAIDRPITDFASSMEVGANVYARGAIAYAWLRLEVGDQAFFALLREWATSKRFQLVDAATWRALMSERLGAEVTERFFTRWIAGSGLTDQEVVAAAVAAAQGKSKP